ncbi:MAG: aldo/keto reductase, partial [Pseudomonadota bacterium]
MTNPRRLGDMQIGPVAFGCWRFAGATAQEADARIRAALDAGLTLIDTADIYGYGEPGGFGAAEALLGEVLGADPALRPRMTLATKAGVAPPTPYDSSPDYLHKAIDASLRRLKTDAVDLFQLHRPDLMTPWEAQAEALDAIIAAGKARHVGVSNFTVAQTRALQAHMTARIVSTQPEFSALHQDPMTDGVLDWCSETRATALAWSPLAGGALATGDAADYPRGDAVLAVIDRLAETYGIHRSQIALAFLMNSQ